MSRTRSARTRPAVVLLCLALAASAVSCARKEETAETTPPPEATNPAAGAPTDAEIAAIVVAANTIDIKNGELAKSKSKNADVKAFADEMIAQHTSVNKSAADLAGKLGLTPVDNATSLQLVQNGDATRAVLATKEGADFDKAYIDNEVTYHQAVLDLLDQTIVPSTENAELKDLIVSVRPTFVTHLDHAKSIQAKLNP